VGDSYHTTSAEEEDPRKAVARRRLEAARAELVAKEATKPRAQRKQAARTAAAPTLRDLAPSLSGAVFVHAILLALAVTFAALALVWCYALLNVAFLAGRVIALPAGILAAVALSYASGCYLGIIESTAQGHTTVEDALEGDWRDWFWSLPMTLGMAALAAAIGYVLSLIAPAHMGTLIAGAILVLYPILQLSSLEIGSPLAPISLPVLRSLVTRPLAWLAFYGATIPIALGVAALARAAWRDPPYVTMLVMGPAATVALLVYGWLLGQLARWISSQRTASEED